VKLTVKEYSTAYNVSIQSVYKRIQRHTIQWVKENNIIYVVVDKEAIKAVEQPLVKEVEQVSLKYLLKQLKIRDKKIEGLEKKLDKKAKEIKKLNKQLLQSTSDEKDTLLSFISELKQLQLQAPIQDYKIDEEVIEVNPKKKKKKSKK
jgi:hypothetical protein